ncbi:hypothetical protein Tco_1314093 [Tanacetum coccineum]
MGTKVTSSSGSVLEEPEIQKLQMQAKIFKENSLNKLNALKSTTQLLDRQKTLYEMDSKSALSVIKLQFERFINSDLLKPLDIYSRSFSSDQEKEQVISKELKMTLKKLSEDSCRFNCQDEKEGIGRNHYTVTMPRFQEVLPVDIKFYSYAMEQSVRRFRIANLIANLTLDTEENKTVSKQLKKANTSLTQELKECKTNLDESSKALGEATSSRDSSLIALQTKQTELEKYTALIPNELNPHASAQNKDAKYHNTTKRYVLVEKISESKKPERLIPKGHRWVPTRKLLNSCTGKVENEPTHGSNVDIPHIHACKQTLGLSAGTSFNGQKQQRIDLNADALHNEKQENLRVWPRSSMLKRRLIAADQASVFMAMMSDHNSLVLHQMTSDHNRSELGIQDHSNEQTSSKLVPKVVPLAVQTDKSQATRSWNLLISTLHIAMQRTTDLKKLGLVFLGFLEGFDWGFVGRVLTTLEED